MLVSAAQNLTVEQLGSSAWDELHGVMLDYCQTADLAMIRSLMRRELLPFWPEIEVHVPSGLSASLSPAGKLLGTRAAVTLLHSPDDPLVPLGHAEQNHRELSARRTGTHTLAVTRMLDHVRPNLTESLKELPTLIDCFSGII